MDKVVSLSASQGQLGTGVILIGRRFKIVSNFFLDIFDVLNESC